MFSDSEMLVKSQNFRTVKPRSVNHGLNNIDANLTRSIEYSSCQFLAKSWAGLVVSYIGTGSWIGLVISEQIKKYPVPEAD